MSTGWDVIVVGGGLHGLSAAMHIARRDQRVLVLEKDRVAAHASSYSAGGVRTLGRHPAEIPLAVQSMAIWHRIADLVGDDCGFRSSATSRWPRARTSWDPGRTRGDDAGSRLAP